MKKILQFIITMLFINTVNAQVTTSKFNFFNKSQDKPNTSNARLLAKAKSLKLADYTEYQFDETDKVWYITSIYYFTYNANGNVLTEVVQNKYGTSYENADSTASTYDDNNNELSNVYSIWDENELVWIPQNKTVSTYNSNHQVLTQSTFTWDNDYKLWLDETETKNNYKNNLLKNSVKTTIGSDLADSTQYFYNSNNSIDSILYYTIDPLDATYVDLNKKEIYTYDLSNRLTDITYYQVTTFGVYQTHKYVTTYDNNNYKNSEVYLIRDEDDTYWINTTKTVVTNDSYGNVTDSKDFTWDELSSEWIITEDTKYTYDTQVSKNEIAWFLTDNDLFKNKLTSVQETYYTVEGVYDYKDSISFNYSNFTALSDLPIKNESISVNYSNNNLYVNIGTNNSYELNLYTLNGKLVLSSTVDKTANLSTESLTKGLYIFKIYNNSNIETGKVLID